MCLSQAKSVLGLGVDSAQNGPSQRRQTATAEAAFPVLTSGCLYQTLKDRESAEPLSPRFGGGQGQSSMSGSGNITPKKPLTGQGKAS